jgi:hypothetical protein
MIRTRDKFEISDIQTAKHALRNNIDLSFQIEDVRAKGKDAAQPHADMIKEQIAPLRKWVREFQNPSCISGYCTCPLDFGSIRLYFSLVSSDWCSKFDAFPHSETVG